MIFGKYDIIHDSNTIPHPYFALFPTKLVNGKIAWLQWIWECKILLPGQVCWRYGETMEDVTYPAYDKFIRPDPT